MYNKSKAKQTITSSFFGFTFEKEIFLSAKFVLSPELKDFKKIFITQFVLTSLVHSSNTITKKKYC